MIWAVFKTLSAVLNALEGLVSSQEETRNILILAQDKDSSGKKSYMLTNCDGLKYAKLGWIFGTSSYYEVITHNTGLFVDIDGPGCSMIEVLGVVLTLELLINEVYGLKADELKLMESCRPGKAGF